MSEMLLLLFSLFKACSSLGPKKVNERAITGRENYLYMSFWESHFRFVKFGACVYNFRPFFQDFVLLKVGNRLRRSVVY